MKTKSDPSQNQPLRPATITGIFCLKQIVVPIDFFAPLAPARALPFARQCKARRVRLPVPPNPFRTNQPLPTAFVP